VAVVSFVFALLGLVLVMLREVFGAIGRSIHPAVVAASGILIAAITTWTGAKGLARTLPAGWVKSNLRWLAPAAVVLLAIMFWLAPAPVKRSLLPRLSGNTNVAVVDFVIATTNGDTHGSSSETAELLVHELSKRAKAGEIDVGRFDQLEDAPLDDLERRDEWAIAFSNKVNAHIIVGGVIEPFRGVGSRITPLVYVRPDAVPDAPELSQWLKSARAITTLYDVLGSTYGPADREQLAKSIGDIVTDLVLFARATNELRAGRPESAAEILEQLRQAGSGVIPTDVAVIFEADAALIESQTLTGEKRRAALEHAEVLLEGISDLPRARFALAEVHFQQAAASSCASGATATRSLAGVEEEYRRLLDEPLPNVVRIKARLGILKTRSCAINAGVVDESRRDEEIRSVRAEAQQLEADADRLVGPDALAAKPLVARALVLWPELVL
jgi:hypothetical protein